MNKNFNIQLFAENLNTTATLSLIHISEPTRH